MLGNQKSRTTPYHTQGDPQTEKFNHTLLDMLGTLSIEKKQHWSRHIAAVIHVYYSTENYAKGYSPYLLMFGREAQLPVDLAFGIFLRSDVNDISPRIRRLLKKEFEKALGALNAHGQRNKNNFYLKTKVQDL